MSKPLTATEIEQGRATNNCLSCGKDCKYTFCSDECMFKQMAKETPLFEAGGGRGRRGRRR